MVNAGARLDRLPISRFHYGLLGLIAGGMFLDAFEIYLQGGVLAALVASGWSTPAINANFLSATFGGMVIGAYLAGVFGDRYGRRAAYQVNLLIFGLASLAGAMAPSMNWLIGLRFLMGLGLGAEIVVGYVTISEFVPPGSRWRWMFVIVGVGALIVWFLRRNMPESPRWLESKGRDAKAEAQLREIERQVAPNGNLPDAPVAPVVLKRDVSIFTLFTPRVVMRTITGSVVLIALNVMIYGFIQFLPTFMVKQGMSIVTSLNYTTLMSFGGPVGALIGFFLADRLGRRNLLIGFSLVAIAFGLAYPHAGDPVSITLLGFGLVTSVYVLVAVGWALYVPELFPTEIRMRGNGFCNMAGRMMAIIMPQFIVPLFGAGGVGGVMALVIGLLVLMTILVALTGYEARRTSLEAVTPWAEEDEKLARIARAPARL